MTMHYFWAQNGTFAPKYKFFEKGININSTYLFTSFILQNFKKNHYSGSRVMMMHHFWGQNGKFALNEIFSEKLLIQF